MNTLTLQVINGPNTGRSAMASAGEKLVVGRIRSADFAIIDPRMSREHFVLVSEDGRWLVRDLASSNGTLVNEQKGEEWMIQDGDVITAGDTRFRVVLGQDDPNTNAERNSESQPAYDNQTSRRRTWTED